MPRNVRHARKRASEEKPWTVMLYMTAAPTGGQSEAVTARTEAAAIADIAELEKVGTTDEVNVVIQLDRRWPGYPERYCLRPVKQGLRQSEFCEAVHGCRNVHAKNSNGGEPDVLRDFVTWCQKRYRAKHYMLVLWGHAYGLGFGRDHNDPLTLPEIAKALSKRKIDILGCNACAMSYAEAAYELSEAAKYLLASEITTPFDGWPYGEILKEIVKNPSIDPKDLGKKIIDHFMSSLRRKNVSLTLLDLKRATEIKKPLKNLASKLSLAVRRTGLREPIADAFLDTAHGEVRPLIDLSDLCQNLAKVDNQEIVSAAEAIKEFLDPGDERFVIKHECDPELEGLHGVGIFVPSVTGAADLTRLELSKPSYKQLKLTKGNQWAALVFGDLKGLLAQVNRLVAGYVRATGAAGRDERTGVAQLFVSVQHSFDKLERTLTTTHGTVISILNGTPNNSAASRDRSLRSATEKPPELRLSEHLPQLPYVPVTALSSPSLVEYGGRNGNGDHAAIRVLLPVARSLEKLEEAVANVERTARRALTNSRFGLGPPDVKSGLGPPDVKSGLGPPDVKSGLGPPDVKSGLGPPDVKSGLGPPDVKSGLGPPDVKSGLGLPPWLVASEGSETAILYGQVAGALYELENAVMKLENVPLTNGLNQGAEKKWSTERVERAFRDVGEVVNNARQTAWWAAAHPGYGLGPGPQPGLGVDSRHQLAAAAGLSSRFLRLL